MKTLAALLILLSAAPARAIELSLEENRAERGSVGYVDLQRLFAVSPDAQRAKDGFQELVRQAEERVNLRKAELLKLHQQLDAVRSERDELIKTSTPSTPAVVVSTPAVDASTAIALPGMSGAGAPPPPVAVAPSSGPTLGQRLLEFNGKIIGLQSDVARKEAEVTLESDDAHRGLLDIEGRKTDQVLARLYRAIAEVSRREGVSVVVDKTTILYGHPAVDMTDRVLKFLRESDRL